MKRKLHLGLVVCLLAFAQTATASFFQTKAFVVDRDFLKDIINDGISKRTDLNLRVRGTRMTHYRFKAGAWADLRCNREAGYSEVLSRNVKLQADLSNTEDGLVGICLVGLQIKNGNVIGQQAFRQSTKYLWYKDAAQALSNKPLAVVRSAGFLRDIADGQSDREKLNLSLKGLNRANVYAFKVGEADTTNCNVAQGYSSFRPISSRQRLQADLSELADGGVKLCIVAAQRRGWRIKGKDFSRVTVYEWQKGTPVMDPPAPFAITGPTGLIDGQLPSVTWEQSTGATFYDVAIATDASCSDSVASFENVDDLTVITATPLATGTYFSCVTAKNDEGLTTAATNNGLQFDVDVTAPEAFSVVGPTGNLTDNSPLVEWQAAAGAETYDLTLASDAGCTNAVLSQAGLTDTTFQTSSLADGAYFVCVTAKDDAGNMTLATNNGLGFTIDTMPPSAFAILGPLGETGDNTPEVQWEASSGAISYDVTVASDSSCSVVIESATTTTTSFEASELADGTYYTCVVATDDFGLTTEATNNGAEFTVSTAPALTHTVFATSIQTNLTTSTAVPPSLPTFGGIEAASWICTLRAFSAGLFTGWNGQDLVYKAILSDGTRDARDWVGFQGAIFNTNGDLVANDSADFFDGQLITPIGFDESGNAIAAGDDRAWSGVDVGGTFNTLGCGNWDLTGPSVTSASSASSTSWLAGPTLQCNNDSARLICASPAQ